MQEERLNKYIAQCGICSRREADRLIEEGKVTVNGSIPSMGQKVSSKDEIKVNGKLIGTKDDLVVLAYNKPIGVTCTSKDDHAEEVITDVIDYPVRVTYAGRLDRDSEGLILLTNDGDLINRLMKGANHHEKEYQVRINKEVTESFLERMSSGIYLKELDVSTRPCEIVRTGKYTFNIILTQGLNKQIRRMCKACHCEVVSLRRIRVGNILLGKLPVGKYRVVEGRELEDLRKLISGK